MGGHNGPTGVGPESAVRAWQRLRPGSRVPDAVELLDGVRKRGPVYRLVGAGPGGCSVIAKQRRWCIEHPEVTIYLQVHPELGVRMPECYGFVETDEEDGFSTLFLEDVGDRDYSPSSPLERALVGRWLAELHGAFEVARVEESALARLPDRRPTYYLALLQELQEVLRAWPPTVHAAAEEERTTLLSWLGRVEDEWAWIEDCCAQAPAVLVHADLGASNVRIQQQANGTFAPVVFDWDRAGLGPPVVDLDDRIVDVDAYVAWRRRLGGADLPPREVLTKASWILSILHKNAYVKDLDAEDWWEEADHLERYSGLLAEAFASPVRTPIAARRPRRPARGAASSPRTAR